MGFDYGKYFGEIRLLHDLTTRADERRWRLMPPEARPGRKPIVLYLGCNVLRTSHMVRTVTAVFDRLGLDYVAVGGPTYCCGIVHHQQGDAAAGGGMANRTLELFERYQPDEVVMWCPSCIYFYDEVRHATVPYRVRHTTEFLLDRVPDLIFTAPVERAVAVHAHCEGEARQREARACRSLLAVVPGVRLVPLESEPRFGRSCAPAIPLGLGQDVWDGLVRDEIERARAAGADTLAGIYHGCHRMICGFEAEGRIRIEHYLSVFARALGIDFEDQFKKYPLWGDPDRVLEDMTPCQQGNGVRRRARWSGRCSGSAPRPEAPRPLPDALSRGGVGQIATTRLHVRATRMVKIHVCVTTASIRLGEADLARQPWAGGLLVVDAGVRGLPEPRFGG